MSAGQGDHVLAVCHDLSVLAPKFRAAVKAGLADCQADGLDAVVYETGRSRLLAVAYYARGRTVKPPERPVTNAPDETYTWHGYDLAVDVISASRGWNQPDAWFARMAAHFKRHGCRWGGDWRSPDLPHIQWGCCKPSPSDRARELLRAGGVRAVWAEVLAA